MKKYLVIGLILSLALGGVYFARADKSFGAWTNSSVQIGTTPANGDLLQTNGTTSTWVATSTLAGGMQTPWLQNINANGYTLNGSSTASGNLTLMSTSNATKGKILFGTSAYDEVNNRLGIGTTSPASLLSVAGTSLFAGRMVLGTNTPSNDDSGLLIARAATNPLSLGGSHAVRDESTYTITSGTAGYASFDAVTAVSGSVEYNHIAGFQARQIYTGSGTLLAGQGFVSYPTISGPTTNINHFVAYNPLGASPITNQYGLYIYPLTRATNNYGIYSAGTMPSYFGGNVTSNSIIQALTFLVDPYLITAADGFYNSTAGTWQVKAENVVAGGARPMTLSSGNGTTKTGGQVNIKTDGTTRMTIDASGNVGIGTTNPASRIHGVTTLSAATGDEIAYQLNYTTNKVTSGNDTGLVVNQSADTASPGTSLLADFQVGGVSKFSVSNTGTTTASQFRLSALNTAPATATSTGTLGEIRIVADYIYICIGANSWVRSALSSW